MKTLFSIRGFAAFTFILLLNATVDIAHKITIQNVLLKTYEGGTLIALSALINALILLPFILLFSPSGYLSDRFSKTRVIRYATLGAIALTILITFAYYMGWFIVAFALTFLLAIQSAVYSPAKYGLIKELVGTENLGAANGVVQAVTIASILLSATFFSFLFEHFYGGVAEGGTILESMVPLGLLLVAFSALESYLAFRLPLFEAPTCNTRFEMKRYFNLSYLRSNITRLRSDNNIWLSILGLSVFWGVGQIVVAAFPAHYKAVTGDENALIVQAILAMSAIGLVLGSALAGRLSSRHIELGIVPLGALGMLGALLSFGSSTHSVSMALSSLVFGFFGGLFIVPLNAIIQFFAPQSETGVILAGNNFVQNVVMVLFLALSIALVQVGFSAQALFVLSAVIVGIGSLYTVAKLPQLFARILLLPILRTRYRYHVRGLEHLPQKGGVLLLGNHISWIDWLVLQVASPRAIKYVMAKSIYNRWYLKWFLELFNVIPISGASGKDSIEQIRARLDNGEVVALFPEGRISLNGQFGSFKKGFEMAIKESSHPIVPFYLHGLWGSTFSRAEEQFKKMSRWGDKRDVVVAFGTPLDSDTPAERVKSEVRALSQTVWEERISAQPPLQYGWLRRAKADLFKRSVADATGADLSNLKMLTGVLLFAKALLHVEAKNVGVLLPASAAGSIVNMALLVLGKRPVNLNYTLSREAIEAAISKAQIETIVTSEKFVAKLKGKGFDMEAILGERMLFAEEIGKGFSKGERIMTLLKALLMPSWLLEKLYFKKAAIDDVATVLFSSGSEGTPKGIELTHKNLLANISQIAALLNFQERDVILNSLPIFHSFGLTVTTLLPLHQGVAMVSAPDPTDAFAIGKLAAHYGVSIMFGTSTFYRLYTHNKKLHPLMLQSLRMAVAGAEKLSPQIKEAFYAKFGVEIYEGYGATETAPVVSVNMPDALELDSMQVVVGNKVGSVGQALPGTSVKIVDPDSLQELGVGEDGLIIVGGAQVMKGYLDEPEKSAEVLVEIDGVRYYKTGDKGHLDEDGFITIVDRYSRFAKIGGEMISLGSVEVQLTEIFGESIELAAVAVGDEKKGEQVVMLYSGEHDESDVTAAIKASDIAPIMQPGKIFRVETLPKLASGKGDFKAVKALAAQLVKG